ncbi:MAG: RecT family recombinase [Leucobacter sp.]
MSAELMEKLPQDANIKAWSPSQYALMQQLGLVDRSNWKGKQPDAPLGVIEAFLMQCQRTQLDPAARQIYAAEMGGKWTVLISIDGFRLIADRTGLYRGKKPTEWCGEDGVWRDVWLSPEPPAAARISVMREGFTEPLVAVATYSGYCPRDRKTGDLKPSGQWVNNPSNQLAKCAEMLALRQAFPNELSGLYGTEEMQQAGTAKPPQRSPQPAPAPVEEPVAEEAPIEVEVVEEFDAETWAARVAESADVDALRKVWDDASAEGVLSSPMDATGTPLGAMIQRWKSRLQESA